MDKRIVPMPIPDLIDIVTFLNNSVRKRFTDNSLLSKLTPVKRKIEKNILHKSIMMFALELP